MGAIAEGLRQSVETLDRLRARMEEAAAGERIRRNVRAVLHLDEPVEDRLFCREALRKLSVERIDCDERGGTAALPGYEITMYGATLRVPIERGEHLPESIERTITLDDQDGDEHEVAVRATLEAFARGGPYSGKEFADQVAGWAEYRVEEAE